MKVVKVYIEQQLLTDVARRDVFNNRMITIYLG